MSPSASQAPSTAKYRSTFDVSDVEPDAEWKAALRKRIEDGLRPMAKDAKDHLEAQLRKAPVSVEERERLTVEYTKAMTNIRSLAEEEFQLELQREREERRWVAGRSMDPKWDEALKREQQDIMDNIKAQKESSSPKTAEPPDDAIPSVVRTTPVSIPERPPSPAEPDRPRPEPEPERELDRERESERESQSESQSVHKSRRESNTYSSKHRDQISHSLRHASYQPPSDEKVSHVETWVSDDVSEESEQSLLRPPERRNSVDRPSTHETVNRPPMERPSRSLAERHTRPSPKSIPEIWKPSISPDDDARMSSPYTLVRRGSTASMRSTGSAGVRPSIVEVIPERVNDAMEPSKRDKGRFHEIEESRHPPEKMREKERQAPWNDDRQRVIRDSSPLSDDYSSTASAGMSSSRPLDSQGGHYSNSSSKRPVRRKASLTVEEHEYTGGQFPHRLVPRASFTNDRDYPAGPYQAPSSGRPIMRDTSFIFDERDRDRDRDRDRERDRDRDRERERERERENMDRHNDRYGPSRPYPTPPASANRSNYYTPDNYDTRPDPYYRDHEQHSATWRAAHISDSSVSMPYRRTSEGRPGLSLGRDPSYSRKRNEVSSPEDIYPEYDHSPTTSIPIVRPRQSPLSDEGWRGWSDTIPRSREPRYEGDYQRYGYSVDPAASSWRGGPRSPPSSYQGGHRESVNYHNFGGRRPLDDDWHEEDERWWEDGRRKREMEEEEMRQLLKRKQEDMKRKQEEEDAWREEEASRKEDARREGARRIREALEEAKKLEEERARKEEETKRMEEEYRKKEQEVRRKEAEQKKKEEEVKQKEAEAKQKEAEARRKEEETRKKEEEIRRKEEDARKTVAEATRKAQEATRKAQEAWKKEEEIRLREEELRKREEELKRREEEASLKEAERLQKQYDEEQQQKTRIAMQKRADEDRQRREQERRQQEEENKRKEQERWQEEEKLKERQQEEFRKREAEVKAEVAERKRQDSGGADGAWGPSSFSSSSPVWPNSHRNGSTSSASTDKSSATSWNSNSDTRSTKSSSTAASTRQASATSSSKPRSGSTGSSGPTSPPPAPPSQQFPMTDEHYKQFMREQERMETARQAREAKKQLTKEDVVRIFERHEEQWKSIAAKDDLQWHNFPWPMLKMPSTVEDITYGSIHGYLLSAQYPEKDRPQKDRVKDQIKRWHPDRFETKLLPKVVEEDREKVKDGAGIVVRTLNELLTRSNGPGNAFSEPR